MAVGFDGVGDGSRHIDLPLTALAAAGSEEVTASRASAVRSANDTAAGTLCGNRVARVVPG